MEMESTEQELNEKKALLESAESKAVTTKDRVWPYLVMAASFVSLALAAGFNLGIAGSLSVSQTKRFNLTLDQASLSTSVHVIFYQLTNPLCTMLTRKISLRKAQLFGCIISLIGIATCKLSTEHWHVILLFGIVTGVGLSFVKASLIGALPYHFEGQELDFATAVTFVGFSAGWVIVTPLSSSLFEQYGFNMTMFMLSPLMLVHLFGVAVYSQDGKNVSKDNLPESKSLKESMKEMFSSATVWAYLCATFLRRAGDAGYFTINQDYAMHDLGLSLTETGEAGAIYGALSVVGTVLVVISHACRIQYNILVCHCVSAFLVGSSLFLISAANSQTSFYIFMGLSGFIHGVHGGNIYNVGRQLAGASNFALISSFAVFFAGLGGLTGPPVASYLQVNLGYKYGIYVCGSALIVGGILNSIIAAYKVNQQHNPK